MCVCVLAGGGGGFESIPYFQDNRKTGWKQRFQINKLMTDIKINNVILVVCFRANMQPHDDHRHNVRT